MKTCEFWEIEWSTADAKVPLICDCFVKEDTDRLLVYKDLTGWPFLYQSCILDVRDSSLTWTIWVNMGWSHDAQLISKVYPILLMIIQGFILCWDRFRGSSYLSVIYCLNVFFCYRRLLIIESSTFLYVVLNININRESQ